MYRKPTLIIMGALLACLLASHAGAEPNGRLWHFTILPDVFTTAPAELHCTVHLDGPAPSGGMRIALKSSKPKVVQAPTFLYIGVLERQGSVTLIVPEPKRVPRTRWRDVKLTAIWGYQQIETTLSIKHEKKRRRR